MRNLNRRSCFRSCCHPFALRRWVFVATPILMVGSVLLLSPSAALAPPAGTTGPNARRGQLLLHRLRGVRRDRSGPESIRPRAGPAAGPTLQGSASPAATPRFAARSARGERRRTFALSLRAAGTGRCCRPSRAARSAGLLRHYAGRYVAVFVSQPARLRGALMARAAMPRSGATRAPAHGSRARRLAADPPRRLSRMQGHDLVALPAVCSRIHNCYRRPWSQPNPRIAYRHRDPSR